MCGSGDGWNCGGRALIQDQTHLLKLIKRIVSN
jgi:hypothetical protein